MYKNINTTQLYNINSTENINLIDVREKYEYAAGHVPKAKNIPVNEIATNYPSYLNQNDTYYIICQSGGRSSSVCQYLSSRGYNVINVVGGTGSYMYPLER